RCIMLLLAATSGRAPEAGGGEGEVTPAAPMFSCCGPCCSCIIDAPTFVDTGDADRHVRFAPLTLDDDEGDRLVSSLAIGEADARIPDSVDGRPSACAAPAETRPRPLRPIPMPLLLAVEGLTPLADDGL